MSKYGPTSTKYGKEDRVPTVTDGVPAPTTATVGVRGDVRFDTDGNRWELIKIVGSVYYWSPDGFPAVNTEYPACVEDGVVVWKYRYYLANTGTTDPAITNHGIANIATFKPIGSDCYVGGANNTIRKGFYSAANRFIQFSITTTQVVTNFATPTFNNASLSTEFYYTKT